MLPSSVIGTSTAQSPKLEILPVSLILHSTPISIPVIKTCCFASESELYLIIIPCKGDWELIFWVETGKKILVSPDNSDVHACIRITKHKLKLFPPLF